MTVLDRRAIGRATLFLGDCLDILPSIELHLDAPGIDHIITDPPYGERTHVGHNDGARDGRGGHSRRALTYSPWSANDVNLFSRAAAAATDGWIVWMCDHHLAPAIQAELEFIGRYVFAPLPYVAPGSRIRLSGDGPSNWTNWIVVSRTAAQHRWGTLPGAYIRQSGWDVHEKIGGKPIRLMEAIVGDYSRRGEVVCDPCMGAGSTGIAALNLGRSFVGIERDPEEYERACHAIAQSQRQLRLFS